MKDKSIMTLKKLSTEEIQVYVEDAVGHHASITLQKKSFLNLLRPILSGIGYLQQQERLGTSL